MHIDPPRGPQRADRGRRGHRQGADRAGQGAALRPVRGWGANDPTRARFESGDFRNTVPRFADTDARRSNRAFVDLVTRIADRKKATPAQVALAWLLAQKPWIVPIPGTTKLPRLEENLAAADVALTADDLGEISDAQIQAQGGRYSEANERMIDR